MQHCRYFCSEILVCGMMLNPHEHGIRKSDKLLIEIVFFCISIITISFRAFISAFRRIHIAHIDTARSHITLSICHMLAQKRYVVINNLGTVFSFCSTPHICALKQLRCFTSSTFQSPRPRDKRIPMSWFFARYFFIRYAFPLLKSSILNLILRPSPRSHGTECEGHQKLFHFAISLVYTKERTGCPTRSFAYGFVIYFTIFLPFTTYTPLGSAFVKVSATRTPPSV